MDPTRLRDDPDQPEGLRDLLDHSVRDVGSRADIAKTAAKLLPLVGVSALGVTTSSAVKASVWAGKSWWLAGVVGGSVALAGVAVVVSGPSTQQIREAVPVVQPHESAPLAPMPPRTAPPPAESSDAPVPTAQEVAAPRTAVKVPARTPALPPPVAAEAVEPSAPVASAPAAPASAGPSETQLLGAAQASLASDPARALKLTAEHRQLFPSGAFTQEREVIEIDALYRLGRKAEADRRATQFVSRNPNSSYGRRVKELLAR